MEKTRDKYILYFINVFISGIVYSFMTSKLIFLEVNNSLIVILISSVVDLIIMYDIRKHSYFEKIPPYIYSVISLLFFS